MTGPQPKSPAGRHCDECAAPATSFVTVPLCDGCFESHHLFYERCAIKIDSGIPVHLAMQQAREELAPQRSFLEMTK